MARVLCTLPHASELINDVKFVAGNGGMVSEDIADDVAENFAKIPGYTLVDKKGKAVKTVAESDAPAGAETPAAPAAA